MARHGPRRPLAVQTPERARAQSVGCSSPLAASASVSRAARPNASIAQKGRPEETRALFERVTLGEDFPPFLTLPAYEYLD